MLSIFSVLIPIFGIMGLGAFAERRHLLPAETAKCLNQFVYWFSLPMLLFYIMAQIRLETMSWAVVGGGTAGLLISQGLMTLLLRCSRYSWKQATMGGMVSSFPNVAFMGIPVIMLLYPANAEAKLVAGIMAILPTSNLVITDIALTLQSKQSQGIGQLLKHVWRGLYTNPSLIGASLGACVGLLELPIPAPLVQMSAMVGNTASPCALFCIGMSLASQLATWRLRGQESALVKSTDAASTAIEGTARGGAKFAALSMVAGKLFFCPLVMYVCCVTLGIEGMSLAVMTILGAMPTAVLCHIIASKHDVIASEATLVILMGTLLSLPSLACVIAIVQHVVTQ